MHFSALVSYLLIFSRLHPLTIQSIINDLLGGRGWWLVKGALVRGPFLLPMFTRTNHFWPNFIKKNSF